jgi:predicted HAD superfamily phosphohydrolase YqeG
MDLAYSLGVKHLDEEKEKRAVMFDIDDTLIKTDGSLILPMIDLLRYCKVKGHKVIIITARDSRDETATRRQLLFCNIKFDAIYFRHDPQDNHNMFKSDIKKMLFDKGTVITMSVGDQMCDVNGPYSGYRLKLPSIRDSKLYHGPCELRMVPIETVNLKI